MFINSSVEKYNKNGRFLIEGEGIAKKSIFLYTEPIENDILTNFVK